MVFGCTLGRNEPVIIGPAALPSHCIREFATISTLPYHVEFFFFGGEKEDGQETWEG